MKIEIQIFRTPFVKICNRQKFLNRDSELLAVTDLLTLNCSSCYTVKINNLDDSSTHVILLADASDAPTSADRAKSVSRNVTSHDSRRVFPTLPFSD